MTAYFMKISSPHSLGELRGAHSHFIGKVTHYWPQARKREDGYESKGKLEKKNEDQMGLLGVPGSPESSTVSERETQSLPHLLYEKLFLSSQYSSIMLKSAQLSLT